MKDFVYREGDRVMPIPEWEKNIQAIEAEHVRMINDQPGIMLAEGLCFDREGKLLITGTFDHRIYRFDCDTKEMEIVYEGIPATACSCKVHKDGRIFACSNSANSAEPGLFVLNPDGTGFQKILSGISINDFVFDSKGGIYFTEYTGNLSNPTGKVIYLYPDMKTTKIIVKNLMEPNGCALSTDGNILWVADDGRNCLYRFFVGEGFDLFQYTDSKVYQFAGFAAPDSMDIDSDDNVYVALFPQGRVMVFNYYGFPIGQILMPERDKMRHLMTTHPAIRPGTKDLYIAGGDYYNGKFTSDLYVARSFAEADMTSFQFR